tara:strand:+ start:22835 stop:23587 length:753 start_codon:yes stop_codon:yes gene_type:complete
VTKILITRPIDQAQDFAARILERLAQVSADDVVLEPLLHIEHNDVGLKDADHYDGVIVTSANALPTLLKNRAFLDKPFYCVGEKTAEKLQKAGAANISLCADTAEELIHKIVTGNHAQAHLLYLRGRDIMCDIKQRTQKAGLSIEDVVCYSATPVDHLSPRCLEMFQRKETVLLTLFSKRTAEVFVRVLQNWEKESAENSVDAAQIHILCISPPVVEYMHTFFNRDKVIVSARPDRAGMLDAVEKYFSEK